MQCAVSHVLTRRSQSYRQLEQELYKLNLLLHLVFYQILNHSVFVRDGASQQNRWAVKFQMHTCNRTMEQNLLVGYKEMVS